MAWRNLTLKSRKPGITQPDLLLGAGSEDAASDPLELLRRKVEVCNKCELSCQRANAVFGEGARHAKLMFIGEAPGANEDATGMPFVGRAGQMLTRTLESNGISRDDVFISNVVKCRPPENRDPTPKEIEACSPFLYEQIDLINPAMVCALGRYAAAAVLGRPVKITQEHGIWMEYRERPFMIAMHPSAAMRSIAFREQFERDIALLAERYHSLPD